MLARLALLPGPWRRAAFGDHPPAAIPDPPDSALATEAEEKVRALSSSPLYAHCLRTWAFAALFAERDRVKHDRELLYLACVLHDLGLTEAHTCQDKTAQCFAVEGARAARNLLRSSGEPDERARQVAEAISLHLNISVPARYGPEAGLLSKGVTLDVVGRRANQLPPPVIAKVVQEWPRAGFSEALLAGTRRQAEVRPDSRAAFLQKLGFTELVSANPLDA